MNDFTKILDKARELEAKVKRAKKKLKILKLRVFLEVSR